MGTSIRITCLATAAVFRRRRNTSRSAFGGSNSPRDFGPCTWASCSLLWRPRLAPKTIFMARRNRRNSSIRSSMPLKFILPRTRAAPGVGRTSGRHRRDLRNFSAGDTTWPIFRNVRFRRSGEPAAATVARLGPTLVRRIRFNYKPKHIAPLGQELLPLIDMLKVAGIGPLLTLDQGLVVAHPKDRRPGMDGTVPKGGGCRSTSRKSFFGV